MSRRTAHKDPRGSDAAIVVRSADDGDVTSGGQRDGDALPSLPRGAAADQLVALPGPRPALTRKDPRSPDATNVGMPAYDSGVAVGRQRDGRALRGDFYSAEQLGPLLDEISQRPMRGNEERSANHDPGAGPSRRSTGPRDTEQLRTIGVHGPEPAQTVGTAAPA